jgi:hypothetical protein
LPGLRRLAERRHGREACRAGSGRPARIETVLSQLTERYHAKRVWARDVWHLTACWLHKLVSPTRAVLPCQRGGLSPLAFAKLITS